MTEPTGVKLEQFPDIGRALVATKDFEIGDLIFAETPALQVPTALQNSAIYKKLLKAITEIAKEFPGAGVSASIQATLLLTYKKLSAEERREITEEYASDTTEDHVLARFTRKVAETVHDSISEFQAFTSDELQKLLLVMIINAIEVSEGKEMKHYALQPIKTGEIVTTNYIIQDDIRVCWTTPMRRQKLLSTKSFLCKCTRCSAPDTNRTAKCPKCQQPAATPIDLNFDEVYQWTCSSCNASLSDTEMPIRMEQQLQTSLLEATAVFDDAALPSIEAFQKAMGKMDIVHKMGTTVLGSEHWITNWPKPFLANKLIVSDIKACSERAIEWIEWCGNHILPYFPHIHVRHVLSHQKYCEKGPVQERYYRALARCKPWINEIFLGDPRLVQLGTTALKEAGRRGYL
ncbi:hypothetical protein HDV00_000010 [Rhizophlyctis rosea]|nr:hypothetical protein HDV00_000010 [Rhizophlyctis rosea]